MFESARLKVDRAGQHIRHFDDALKTFLDRRPYKIVFEGRQGPNYYFVITDPIPDDLMIIVGDAIHNLHTALDHCIWALWTHDVPASHRGSRWANRIKLPLSNTNQTDYESSIDGMVTACGGREDAVILLKKLEVHPEGGRIGRALLALHNLDIKDKHCVLVPMVPRVNISGLIEVTTSHEGETTTNKLGSREIGLAPNFAWSPIEKPQPYGGLLGNGYSHRPFEPKLQFGDDRKIVLQIQFAENQPFPGEPINSTLCQLRDLVSECIGLFEDLVKSRR